MQLNLQAEFASKILASSNLHKLWSYSSCVQVKFLASNLQGCCGREVKMCQLSSKNIQVKTCTICKDALGETLKCVVKTCKLKLAKSIVWPERTEWNSSKLNCN